MIGDYIFPFFVFVITLVIVFCIYMDLDVNISKKSKLLVISAALISMYLILFFLKDPNAASFGMIALTTIISYSVYNS